MSSFLDSTGLSELATKLKSYFMKKPTSASTSSYPLVGYDATNNIGKYNNDITLDMANREILAGNSTPNLATPAAPYSNDITMRTVTGNATYTSLYHKPTKDMYVLVRNGGSSEISVIYGTPSSTSSKHLAPGYMVMLLYTTSNETWSLVGEPALSGGTYPDMTVGTLRFANAAFAGASSGCNILLTNFETINMANSQLNARFLVIFTRASTDSTACASAILEISARNPSIAPYTAVIHAELNILKYSNIFDFLTINVTKVSDRRVQVYATSVSNSVWGGVRLIPISCGSYGDSTNFAGELTLYTTSAAAASSREGTDVTIARNTTVKIPAGTSIGSTSQSVYVDANGRAQPCEPILLTSSGNLNNATPTTFGYTVWYKWYAANPPTGASFINGNAATSVMQSIKTHETGNYFRQICYTAANGIWTRMCNNGTWTTWSKWTD